MSFLMIIAVAIGGALGAVGRLLLDNGIGQLFGQGFPLGTMVINVIGSFCLGVLVEVFSETYLVTPELRAFLVTGILGAFTTFSTFSLDFVSLWGRGEIPLAFGYLLGTVCFGIMAFLAGSLISRALCQ